MLLRVRKRGANTKWVARQLARAAGCREHEVGYVEYDLAGDATIAFRLTRGAFATSVLRELIDCRDAYSGGEEGA